MTETRTETTTGGEEYVLVAGIAHPLAALARLLTAVPDRLAPEAIDRAVDEALLRLLAEATGDGDGR
jgi:hypothetical protein